MKTAKQSNAELTGNIEEYPPYLFNEKAFIEFKEAKKNYDAKNKMNDKLKEMQTLDEVLSEHIDFNGSDYTLINPKSELKTDLEALIEQKVKLGRQEVIDEILENENAWNLAETLAKLLEATEILIDKKDYDGHGWELIAKAQTRGKEFLSKLNNLKNKTEENGTK